MISGAEGGTISVSDRYVSAVLKACKLPANWTGPKSTKRDHGCPSARRFAGFHS